MIPSRPAPSRHRLRALKAASASLRTSSSRSAVRQKTRVRSQGSAKPKSRIPTFFLSSLVIVVLGVIIFIMCYLVFIPKLLLGSAVSQRFFIASGVVQEKPENVLVVSLDQDANRSSFVWVSGTESVELKGNYGKYELRSIVPLFTLEKKDEVFIRGQLSLGLSGVITTLVPLPQGFSSLPSSFFDQSMRQQKNHLAWFFLTEAFESLPNTKRFVELLRLHYFFKDVPAVVEGGQKPHSIDELSEYFKSAPLFETQIAQDCSVAVLNGTRVNGLAQWISRLIEQERGLVIRIDSHIPQADEGVEGRVTKIQVGTQVKTICQPLIESIASTMPLRVQIETIDESILLKEHRAKVVVFLEQDIEAVF